MLVERYLIYGLLDNCGMIRYVGKTKLSLKERLRIHLKRLKGNDHRANWIRGLLKPPLIQLLAETNKEKIANVLEILLIAFYKSFGCQLVNATEGGTGGSTFKGRKHSIESKLKMSKCPWNYGKHLSEKTKRKISESNKGHFISKITKEKISKTLKGRKNTPEQSKRQSEAQIGKKRKPHSLETRQKISKSNKGKHHSKETKLRLSKLNKGKKLSKEHRKKIGNAHRGMKYKLKHHDNNTTVL